MTQRATFGGGCFWCTEAAMKELNGVDSVTPGYAGGHVEDPTYEQVCSGTTGHAEVVQVEYDPDGISYDELVEVFSDIHDPSQREQAKAYIETLDAEYEDNVVTELEPLQTFYAAEQYH